MSTRIRAAVFSFLAMLAALSPAAAEDFNDALRREAAEYAVRLRQAGEELHRTRERIAREKAPLLAELRAAEDRVISLERESGRLAVDKDAGGAAKRRLLQDIDELRRNNNYIATLAQDGLKALGESLSPGEDPIMAARIEEAGRRIEAGGAGENGLAAMDAVSLMIERTRRRIGGAMSKGRAMNTQDNVVLEGAFAFAGPEVFFRPDDGSPPGAVRVREGSRQPVYFPLAQWKSGDAAALFEGRMGRMIADASGGKAIRLAQTSGSLIDHVDKGGKVAYAILLVGLVALVLIVQKTSDVFRFAADSPARVAGLLEAVAAGSRAQAQAALAGLRPVTRDLFAEGLRNLDRSRVILEERLESHLLTYRLRIERRLPLLAVIATAAPLMGLLGTVVGMVKTFSLITVFGTGNAGRLSSGISEVLVATELGLAVAIPTLVVHGFLANRAHKHVALQERHALEFLTAAEVARTGGSRAEESGA